MAGPTKGSIEHLFLGATQATGSCQTVFVNAYNFLNNNTGTLGIQRIAYHSGSTPTGATPVRSMGFYDQANPAGENAWACFAFSSASVPFYVLIQWAGASTLGTAPGSPALLNGAASTSVMGFAFAQRLDGGNPWNGSSGSNGLDTKGTPVWHPGASSLVTYPRSNDGVRAGSHGTNRQNMQGFTVASSTDYRLSMVADYDNIAFLFDTGADNSYAACIFGIYTELSGVSAQVPYFSLNESALPFTVGSAYGTPAGTTNGGGVAYPNVAISGTCTAGIDRYGTTFFQSTNAQPNRAFATPMFNEFPLLVGINESPNQIGAVGQTFDFYREAFNILTHDTNGGGTRAAFGAATLATIKLTIPWHSGTVPGSGVTRVGIQF